MKIGFQLKQIRKRLAKGLVDKDVLRIEKRNFLLFDMATPPCRRHVDQGNHHQPYRLPSHIYNIRSPSALDVEGVQCRATRAVCLVCAAYTAGVLNNAFERLNYEARKGAFQRCDEILSEFTAWPFGGESWDESSGSATRRQQQLRIAMGNEGTGRESVLW